MKHYLLAILATLGLLVCLFTTSPAKETTASEHVWKRAAGFAIYVEIPGASHVGPDTCVNCHAAVSKNFQHAFHKQQGVECEDCHGYGSAHVDGGGDVTKIVSFGKRPAQAANGVCLGCHSRDEKTRHWLSGSHSANRIRCIDCHQVHAAAVRQAGETRVSYDTATRGMFTVEQVSPETNALTRPRSQTNEACLKCHQTEGAQLSLPYHHPLREGKMSCVDCHDPHGGPAGNNLRAANVNQLCLGCHAQYRGPFAYQHPPVTENCMICHNVHGSANTNLLSVSLPALCLQCHTGHHNGAGLPIVDRCTNCHGSIHGTDVATPSGGSRFVDKGPYGVPTEPVQPVSGQTTAPRSAHAMASGPVRPIAAHAQALLAGSAGGALGVMSSGAAPLWGESMAAAGGFPATTEVEVGDSAFSVTPGSYRFVHGTGFLGRVGQYDTLQQSLGTDAQAAWVSPRSHLTVITRANVQTGDDYTASGQLTAGELLRMGFNVRSFMQQQNNYPFYAGIMSPDLLPITDSIPANSRFAVKRRLGDAYAQMKVPKFPIHLHIKGNWQARVGETQLRYLDENATDTCGDLCHYTSQFQALNYTTRNIAGGADIDLGTLRVSWEHLFSSFNDRLSFPIGNYAGPFTPGDEPPPPPVPVPPDVAAGNYYLDIPAPNQASTDSVHLTWTASPRLMFNGNLSYSRLRDTLTRHAQNSFNSDDTVTWRALERLRLTADYHQQNVLNNFTPFYDLYGNVSFHRHAEGLRGEYELPKDFAVEINYRHGGITRSNASLWPQVYSFDNTDLLTVVPSSTSNTVGLALRYHDHGYWSGRAGYEWTGTDQPGYLIVPKSNNRIFADFTFTPKSWLVFSNDTSVIVQNAFPAISLLRADGNGAAGDFHRRNRLYANTTSATLRFVPGWVLGLGYSYQQNDLTTYMGFQNDAAVAYVLNEPAVPFKQITQAYWGESTYMVKQRVGFNVRVTYNSARSDWRPDLNPDHAAQLGNAALISQDAFDPVAFQQALANLQLGSTQVSQVIVPQWIGQSKVYYLFPRKFEAGYVFYYGSYRDYWNPNLNGVLRTFNFYLGRSW
jgi:predicted CXXCH cytochrome family protein